MTRCPVDGWHVLAAMPTPTLLLTPELMICGVNAAYLKATQCREEELVGRSIFQAFPDNPADPSATGTANLRASLERARDTGVADTMAVQRYDIRLVEDGEVRWDERFWSPVNAPVLDDAGEAVLLIHRVEDVTDYVRRLSATDEATSALQQQVLGVQADVVARGHELQETNEELRRAHERERRVALTLQEAMLPARPAAAGIDVAVRYLPSSEQMTVGGDWYDVADLGDGRVGVMVGDVVGHGLPAAAVMGQMRSALTAALHADHRPAAALEVLGTFARSVGDGFVATALCLVVDLGEGTLTCSSAGHPPPLLLGAGAAALDAAVGPGLGITERSEPRPQATAAAPAGGLLVCYTDGLVERRGEDLDVGVARLRAAAHVRAELPVEQVADGLLDELRPPDRREDDAALVVVRL